MTIIARPDEAPQTVAGVVRAQVAGALELVTAIEDRAVALVQRISLPAMRVAMSLVFLWFGALKMADATPVGDLVASTLPFVDRDLLVPGMGVLEVALGIGLLMSGSARIVLPVMIGHLFGTFLVLVVQPGIAFENRNPLLLTTIGEFVVKNLVLICAAMVLLAQTPQRREASGWSARRHGPGRSGCGC